MRKIIPPRLVFAACLCAVILFVSFVSTSLAQTSIPLDSPTLNRSVRALGMGNAFIAMDGNEYSPFYNPAGLNDIAKWRIKFLSPTFEAGLNSFKMVSDAIDLENALSDAESDADKIRVLDEFVQKNIGDFKYIRFHLDVVNFVMKNFAAGILIDQRMTFSFRDQSDTNFEIKSVGDMTLYLAGSYGLWEKLLQFGVTLKPIVRFAMDDRITYDVVISGSTSDLGDRFSSLYKDPKFGFAADIGIKSNLNFPGLKDNEKYKKFQETLRPTFAFTWQDIGNPFPTTKTTDSGAVLPFVENQQSINLGFAIHPMLGKIESSFEMDFRRINYSASFMTKFHLGAEVRLPKILSLRGGFNQGYVTAGLTADFKYFILDLATYAEETAIYGSRNDSRRIAVTFNFGI